VLARDGHPAGQVARVDLGRVRAQVIAHQRRAHAQVLDRGQPEPVRAGLEVGSRRKAGRAPERLDTRRGQGAQSAQVKRQRAGRAKPGQLDDRRIIEREIRRRARETCDADQRDRGQRGAARPR
jgi:hypothetical protein